MLNLPHGAIRVLSYALQAISELRERAEDLAGRRPSQDLRKALKYADQTTAQLRQLLLGARPVAGGVSGFTDHPIAELGDPNHLPAPIREITIIGYDGNKYATITLDVIESKTDNVEQIKRVRTSIKLVHCYKERGRYGEVEAYGHEEIKELL